MLVHAAAHGRQQIAGSGHGHDRDHGHRNGAVPAHLMERGVLYDAPFAVATCKNAFAGSCNGNRAGPLSLTHRSFNTFSTT